MNRRRVVVTGLGCVTPVGLDVPATWEGLTSGRSGAGPITHFDASACKVRFACEVKGFDPTAYMDRKEVKRSDRYSQFAIAASVQAMRDAGLEDGTGFVAEDCGVIIGAGIGGIRTFEDQVETCLTSGPGRISPFFIPMYIPDIASGLVSMRFNAKGPNYATVSACSSSGHAIGEAFRTIAYGDADVMIAGGAEAAITIMSVGGFGNMTALSTRNETPETASRPFDASRDGFVLGEGAGVVVLELLEHALARGARIHAEVVGYSATADAYHLTGQPEGHTGLQRAMRRALANGGLAPTDVHYVNAHGTSTPLNDVNEIRAIKAVFGDHAPTMHISSTKSATGHTLGAAGGIEFVATTLAVVNGTVPPTINLHTQDPECDLNCTPNVAVRREITAAISNSAGFGGHNVCLAVRRYAA